jgi:probable phosphoglycerate mutase
VTRYLYLARHGEAVDEESGLTATGREQARLLGQRMAAVPLAAIHHSPLPRAAQTASLVAAAHPDAVPAHSSDLVGDHVPPVGAGLPPAFAGWLADVPEAERAAGAAMARAATARYAVPADTVTHELIVTHSFVIAWFVVHALGAPAERWLGQNHCNCAVTAIRYPPGRPPALMVVNDQTHLPPALRWTGFPPELVVP